MSCSPDLAANLDKACKRVAEAADAGARIVCLPELFKSPYFCQTEDSAIFDLAESIPGPSTEALGKVAAAKKVVIVSSLFERRAAGVYHNTIAILEKDGSIAGTYRKMHIPDDPLYYEKYYFTPGDLGFRAIPTSEGKVGTLICWDQWYPEAARITALQGASMLVYPTAIGWHPKEKSSYGTRQHNAWETIQRSHAIANGVFVVSINRVGHEGPADGGLEFWGGSFVADPFGAILVKGSHDREEILYAEINPREQEETRRNWPFLRDRRIDAYAPILNRIID
ncbi:MAG: carbon-nitrogen hydrolase [Candidatus Sumerlaeaceae bacterium]|nr:carbon-nitrogen hydrolase [Candidatus Sumerlaeaceae bacterium]